MDALAKNALIGGRLRRRHAPLQAGRIQLLTGSDATAAWDFVSQLCCLSRSPVCPMVMYMSIRGLLHHDLSFSAKETLGEERVTGLQRLRDEPNESPTVAGRVYTFRRRNMGLMTPGYLIIAENVLLHIC